MLDVAQFISDRLSNYSGTSQYLYDAATAKCRLYPNKATQLDVFPFAVYQLTGGDPVESMNGGSGIGFQRVIVKAFVADGDYELLVALTKQVVLALAGYQDLANGISSVQQEHEPITDFDEEARSDFSITEFIVGFQKPQLS